MSTTRTLMSALTAPVKKAISAGQTILQCTEKGAKYGIVSGAVGGPVLGGLGDLISGLIICELLYSPQYIAMMEKYELEQGISKSPRRALFGAVAGGVIGAVSGFAYGAYEVMHGHDKPVSVAKKEIKPTSSQPVGQQASDKKEEHTPSFKK